MLGFHHFVLEQKDTLGKWHTLWSDKMINTRWFFSRYGEPFESTKNNAVYDTVCAMNLTDHDVRDTLFAKYHFNILHENGLGDKTGIATPGHPEDISQCLWEITRRTPESVSKGCAYTLTLAEIQNINRCLPTFTVKDFIARRQKKSLHLWSENTLKAIHFIQTDFLNQIIGHLPHGSDADDPDFQLHTSASAHDSLAIANGGKWDTLLPGGDNTRLVFFEDGSDTLWRKK